MAKFVLFGMMIGFFFVAACGRYSKPIPPKDSSYPHPYVVTQEP